MKKLLLTLLALSLFSETVFAATSPLQVFQGGTGSSTITGIPIGAGTSSLQTLTIGANLTLSGTTLSGSAGGSGSPFPFTPFPLWNATGTLLNLTGGVMSTASSTLQSFNATQICISGDCKTAWPAGGAGGSFPFVTALYGVATSTTVGFLNGLIASASSTISDLKTTTLTFSGLASGGLGVDSSGVVYKAATTTFSTGLTYTNGAVTLPVVVNTLGGTGQDSSSWTGLVGVNSGTWYRAATSTLSCTGAVACTSTGVSGVASSVNLATINGGNLLGNAGTNAAVPTSIATSTLFYGTVGQVLGFDAVGGKWVGIATTTVAGTAPITASFANGVNTVACATCSTASAANPSGTVGLSQTNGVAATFMRSDGIPALSQSIIPTWTALHIFSANASSTNLSVSNNVGGTFWVGSTATSTLVGDSATSTLISSLKVKKTSGTAFTIDDQFGTNIVNVSTGSTTAGYDLIELWSATSTGPLFAIDQYGHVTASSTTPVISSCGTAPTITTDSSDFAGTITTGATAGGCTLTFGTAHTTGTHCVISNQSMSVINAMTYTESVTGFVVTETGLGGGKLDYICSGK